MKYFIYETYTKDVDGMPLQIVNVDIVKPRTNMQYKNNYMMSR